VMHQETRLIFAPSLIPRKLKTKTDKYFFFFTTEENSCFFFPNGHYCKRLHHFFLFWFG